GGQAAGRQRRAVPALAGALAAVACQLTRGARGRARRRAAHVGHPAAERAARAGARTGLSVRGAAGGVQANTRPLAGIAPAQQRAAIGAGGARGPLAQTHVEQRALPGGAVSRTAVTIPTAGDAIGAAASG